MALCNRQRPLKLSKLASRGYAERSPQSISYSGANVVSDDQA